MTIWRNESGDHLVSADHPGQGWSRDFEEEERQQARRPQLPIPPAIKPKGAGLIIPGTVVRTRRSFRFYAFLVLIVCLALLAKFLNRLATPRIDQTIQNDFMRPKPSGMKMGRNVFTADALNEISSQGNPKYFNMRHISDLEGRILIKGNLEGARIRSVRADIFIDGSVQGSEIVLNDGRISARSVTKGTGLIIKREGTIIVQDASHSTIEARHLVVHNSENSLLLCELATVTGNAIVTKHPWRDLP